MAKRYRAKRAVRSRKRRRTGMRMRTRMRGLIGSKVYKFKRFVYLTNVNGSDTVPSQFGGISFKISDVPSHTEFTSLFDRYRIYGVAYRWVCRRDPSTNSATAAANQGQYPSIHWVHDFDEVGAPGALSVLQQYPRYKEFYFSGDRPTTKWTYIKPSTLRVGYETGVLSYYEPEWKGLIDCGSENTPHFGMKWAVQNLVAGLIVTLECKYYMVFKNVR